ncbi:uncharacterized protein LOC135396109 [Ornithodoros turicata]|uniref:uncharacterized protein LOC135396109 n=1 Tax=Ornithodoros turicata TaxID=34597 RepID=UPI003139055B
MRVFQIAAILFTIDLASSGNSSTARRSQHHRENNVRAQRDAIEAEVAKFEVQESVAAAEGVKLGFGKSCTRDDQCRSSRGLQCLPKESGSECLCSRRTPIEVNDSGIIKCVRPKAMYESCRNNRECGFNNPNVKCVDFLCYCPPPNVLSSDHNCQPAGFSVAGIVLAATPSFLLVITLLVLGGIYTFHRLAKSRRTASATLPLASSSDDASGDSTEKVSTTKTVGTIGESRFGPKQTTPTSSADQRPKPNTKINRRFLQSFIQCREYRNALREGKIPPTSFYPPIEENRTNQTTTAATCLFKGYATVTEQSTELGTTLLFREYRRAPMNNALRPEGSSGDHSDSLRYTEESYSVTMNRTHPGRSSITESVTTEPSEQSRSLRSKNVITQSQQARSDRLLSSGAQILRDMLNTDEEVIITVAKHMPSSRQASDTSGLHTGICESPRPQSMKTSSSSTSMSEPAFSRMQPASSLVTENAMVKGEHPIVDRTISTNACLAPLQSMPQNEMTLQKELSTINASTSEDLRSNWLSVLMSFDGKRGSPCYLEHGTRTESRPNPSYSVRGASAGKSKPYEATHTLRSGKGPQDRVLESTALKLGKSATQPTQTHVAYKSVRALPRPKTRRQTPACTIGTVRDVPKQNEQGSKTPTNTTPLEGSQENEIQRHDSLEAVSRNGRDISADVDISPGPFRQDVSETCPDGHNGKPGVLDSVAQLGQLYMRSRRARKPSTTLRSSVSAQNLLNLHRQSGAELIDSVLYPPIDETKRPWVQKKKCLEEGDLPYNSEPISVKSSKRCVRSAKSSLSVEHETGKNMLDCTKASPAPSPRLAWQQASSTSTSGSSTFHRFIELEHLRRMTCRTSIQTAVYSAEILDRCTTSGLAPTLTRRLASLDETVRRLPRHPEHGSFSLNRDNMPSNYRDPTPHDVPAQSSQLSQEGNRKVQGTAERKKETKFQHETENICWTEVNYPHLRSILGQGDDIKSTNELQLAGARLMRTETFDGTVRTAVQSGDTRAVHSRISDDGMGDKQRSTPRCNAHNSSSLPLRSLQQHTSDQSSKSFQELLAGDTVSRSVTQARPFSLAQLESFSSLRSSKAGDPQKSASGGATLDSRHAGVGHSSGFQTHVSRLSCRSGPVNKNSEADCIESLYNVIVERGRQSRHDLQATRVRKYYAIGSTIIPEVGPSCDSVADGSALNDPSSEQWEVSFRTPTEKLLSSSTSDVDVIFTAATLDPEDQGVEGNRASDSSYCSFDTAES